MCQQYGLKRFSRYKNSDIKEILSQKTIKIQDFSLLSIDFCDTVDYNKKRRPNKKTKTKKIKAMLTNKQRAQDLRKKLVAIRRELFHLKEDALNCCDNRDMNVVLAFSYASDAVTELTKYINAQEN